MNAPESRITVGIVEDDARVRETFVDIINGTTSLRCAGAFGSCEQALEAFVHAQPEVVLLDIGLPGMSGIEGAALIKERYPGTDILMLTVYDDDEKVFRSICAGASGYILKTIEADQLIQAITEAKQGAPMSPSIARRALTLLRSRQQEKKQVQSPLPEPLESPLTPREIEILQSLVDGLSYKKIADKLFISRLTVHSHIKRIYQKLQVHSMSAAVSKALQQRLIE